MFPAYNTILIDRQLDSYNNLSTLKKATNEDKRIRFSRIPKTTMDLLQRYMQLNSITNGFLFTFEGEPWTDEHHRWTFKKALERAGVERGKRKLVPYSLRFTFRSRAHGFLEMQHIMEMMGHRSEEMSLHYLRINPEQFKSFEQYQATIDRMWEYEAREENEEVDRHEEQ